MRYIPPSGVYDTSMVFFPPLFPRRTAHARVKVEIDKLHTKCSSFHTDTYAETTVPSRHVAIPFICNRLNRNLRIKFTRYALASSTGMSS